MILVTGGTGFLGAYIIQELINKGYPVRAIRRGSVMPSFVEPSVWDKVEWCQTDLFDVVELEDCMQGVSAVVHAAALVSFHKSDRNELYRVNVEGTANMVNAALQAGVSRFVYISSVAAIGRTDNGEWVTEEKKWETGKTHTPYASSKHLAELEVWRGIGEGLSAVILNPSTILGYGDWKRSSSALFKNAWEEFPWYTMGVNGFVDVEDVARATVLLMESTVEGERFIINAENRSFRDLLYALADQLHKKRPSRLATPLLGELAWRLEKIKAALKGKKPLLTRESARVAQSITNFDNRKILSALPGFRFTPLTETIRKAAEKYRQALDGH